MRRRAGSLLVLAGLGATVAGAQTGHGPQGLDPSKALTQYSLDAWTVEDGLPNSTVNAIAQTGDGYVWLATYEGLARFDGIRFVVFHRGNTEGLASSSIRALSAGPDGSLWVGTHGGGMSLLREGRFTRFSTAEGLPSDIVLALEADGEGGVWIGTAQGLARYQGGRIKAYAAFRESVSSLRRDRQGNLWVGTHAAGLGRLSSQDHRHFFGPKDGVPAGVVSSIFQDRAGTLWVSVTGGGLVRLEGERFVAHGTRDGLPTKVLFGVLADRHDALWIATGGAGLVRFHGGRFSALGREEGLADTVLYSLLEDRDGSLWIGTNGAGLIRLRDGRFTTFTQLEGLSHDFAYAIREDAQGTLWAGTSDGLNRLEGGRWKPQPSCGGRLHNVVRSLTVDREGALWAGTYGGGVCRRQGERWITYTRADGLAHDSVRAIWGAGDGALWAGTIAGLSRLQDGRWRTFTTRDGLPADSINAVREDRQGTLWIGTDGGGLVRHTDGRFERFGTAEGLPSNVVLALYEDDGGTLWVGTNAGLARRRERGFDVFGIAAGLPSDSIDQILDDGQGWLWLGTSRGIARVERASLDQYSAGRSGRLRLELFDKTDGLKSAQCTAPVQPAGWRARDGRLWFATTRGMAAVDPARLFRDQRPPPVVLEEVVADERTLDPGGEIRLAAGTASLAFHYTALALTAPHRVRFRYRLEGLDRDWVEARDRRVAYYSHLPPGTYRFRVLAANADGVWNETGAAVSVEMLPRFYQTVWFTVLAATAVVLLAVGANGLHVRSLRQRQLELTRLVDERTRGLVEAKEKAERATSDAEEHRRLAEEADQLKTELLGIAAHDLRNPLQLVSGLSELMGQGLTGPKVDEYAEAIHDASRRMLEIVNSLLTTAALDRGLELRRSPVDLVRLAGLVLEEHGEKAARKQQRLLLEAEEDCRVVVDHDRMRQVLDNMVSNAIKFSPPGKDVRVVVRGEGPKVRLEVHDQGPGLTAQDLPRLFGQFQRLSAKPTGGEPATGLGLSIVKRLVELHGGRVWAESDGSGQGAAFIVELPR